MRSLLQRVVAEVEKLPEKEQDNVALRFLAELTDDATWEALFAKTTDEQLQRMEEYAQEQIDSGGVEPLESLFDFDGKS